MLLSNANRGISNQLAPQAQFRKCAANAIYNKTAPQPTTAHHARNHPLTERDLLQFATGQRRSRPQPTTADQATTRPSCNLQSDSVAAQQKSAAADHSRAQPTRAAPDPLTEQDPLPFIPVGVVLVCVISVCVVSVCVVSVCVVSEREAGGAGETGEAKRDEIQNPTLRCGEKLKETYNRY